MGIFDDGKCGQNIFGAFDNETKKHLKIGPRDQIIPCRWCMCICAMANAMIAS